METLKKLELLLKLQKQDSGTSSNDTICTDCSLITKAEGKNTRFEGKVSIRVDGVDIEENVNFMEEILYEGRASGWIEKALIEAFKKEVDKEIGLLREELKETLGLSLLSEKPDNLEENHKEEGGT